MPRFSLYHWPKAAGSFARKNKPPILDTHSIESRLEKVPFAMCSPLFFECSRLSHGAGPGVDHPSGTALGRRSCDPEIFLMIVLDVAAVLGNFPTFSQSSSDQNSQQY